MYAQRVQEQLVDGFLDKIEAEQFLDVPLMDRVERSIASKQQLERYIEVLINKVGDEKYVGHDTLDRIERQLKLLRSLEREEARRSGGR